jgi:hypothetical protein
MRLIPHKQFARLSLVTGLLFLAACSPGGGTTPPPAGSSSIVGQYNGQFLIDGAVPSVIGNTTFAVDAAGNLNGNLVASGSTTSIGTIKGTVIGSNDLSLSFTLTFESATLGKYTMTGTGAYSIFNKFLGANKLTTKNTSGTYIGDAVIGGTKE